MTHTSHLLALPTPQAVVFDLDGTLIDSRGDIAAACNHALRTLGREEIPVARLATLVGDGGRSLVSRAFAVSIDDPIVEEAFALYLEYYRQHPIDETRYLDGAEAALAAFPRLAIALATNKPRSTTIAILDALGIRDRFGAIAAGGDGPLKPDPASLFTIAKTLGVAIEHVWMIGDGPQDVGAAKAAGAVSVGVLGGFHEQRLIDAKPDVLFPSMRAFVDAAHSMVTPNS